MKLIDVLIKENFSGEIKRVRKLFISTFKSFLGSKSRETKLNFIVDVLDNILNKSEKKFLILRLQREQNKK